MSGRVGEEGHDVDEVDTRDREIGEAAQRLAQAYLCTGELGGTGGGGGGLSSRGILAGCDVGDGVGGGFLGGHCGEKEEREKGRREEIGRRRGTGKRKRKVGKIGSRSGKGKGLWKGMDGEGENGGQVQGGEEKEAVSAVESRALSRVGCR